MTVDIDEAANNPAGRVAWFLRELQKFSVGPSSQQHIADSLPELLAVEAGSAEMYLQVTRLRIQAESVPSALAAYSHTPGYRSIFGHYGEILSVMKMIQIPRSYNVGQVYQSLSMAGWASINFADEVLSGPSTEKKLPLEGRDGYLQDVRGLMDEIVSDETLSLQDRNRIVGLLRAVEDALLQVQLFGTDPVEDAAAAAGAVVAMNPDLLERLQGKKWFKRFVSTLTGLLMLMGAIGGLPALGMGLEDETPPQITVIVGESAPEDDKSDAGQSNSSEAPAEGEIVEGEIVDDDLHPATSDQGDLRE